MTPAQRPRGVLKPWILAWIGGAGIGVANGVLREVTYGKQLSEPAANRVSVVAAVVAFAGFFRGLNRRWPLAGPRESLPVGGLWLALTVCFEFGFGRLVAKKSWRELGAEYDVSKGRLWPLVLAWIAVGPEVIRRLDRRQPS